MPRRAVSVGVIGIVLGALSTLLAVQLTADDISTSWRARAVEGVDVVLLEQVAQQLSEGPGVHDAVVGPTR